MPKRFSDKNSDEEKLNAVIDFNDFILDRVGNVLDDFEGLKKRDQELIIATLNVTNESNEGNATNVASWNQKNPSNKNGVQRMVMGTKNILKPQLKFKEQVDNSSQPFKPILKFKHNSIKPFSLLEEYDEQGNPFFPHPYEHEISSFKVPSEMLKRVKPTKPNDSDATPFMFVITVDQLKKLHKRLMASTQFAIDLEYHSYRSFLGFTCLMQISTRTEDYVVDTLELRDELHILNEPFTNPAILKVFHGAEWDIQWLQKDFGIYVVNMFDTCQAARLLKMSQFSLFFLVKHYCGKMLDKQFQLADWRVRPLTEEMLTYAREDSRNLLYIYDLMRNELIDSGNLQKNLLLAAHERSNAICLKRFEKPSIDSNSHLPIIGRSRTNLNNRQVFALKQLYFWRDRLAREEDESLVYVLPNHMMLKIAEVLPREMQGILSCCNPIPAMVRHHLADLHMLILRARELPLEEESNKNVVQLTRKMNHSIDITNTMDFMDEGHHGQEDHNKECLLNQEGQEGSYRHQVILKRTSESEPINSLLAFLSQKDERDPFVLDSVANYEAPYAKYLKYMERKQKLKEQEKKEERIQPEVLAAPKAEGPMITHTKRRARTEAEYDQIMVDKPLKDMMKMETNKVSKKDDEEEEDDKEEDDISDDALESIDRLLIDAQKESDMKSMEREEELEEVPEAKEIDYNIFLSKGAPNKSDYFDPTKEYLQQKQVFFGNTLTSTYTFSPFLFALTQKNKSFKSRTKRRKEIAVSSATIAKKAKR